MIAAAQAIEDGKPLPVHLLEQLDPGTSMGGARPKATIEDAQCLWLGKFPADCAELFRRMVFNAAVTNNDDHPRNHALLSRPRGWRLSPAYDLVPTPVVSLERRDLALTVGNYCRRASLYNLVSQAGRFGLSAEDACKEIDQIVTVARQWRESFFACGVSAQDLDYIAPAILPECFFFASPPDE